MQFGASWCNLVHNGAVCATLCRLVQCGVD